MALGKTLVTIFSILFIIFGLGFLAVGIWMSADKYVVSYFTILQRTVTDQVLSAAPPILIVSGFFMIGMGVLGLYALAKKKRGLLSIFAGVLLIIVLLELVVGCTVLVFKVDIHRTVKEGMREQIQEDYEYDNAIGKAWNFIQVRHRCCGVDGGWDYQESNWFYGMNPGFEGSLVVEEGTKYVPPTCCVLNFNQDHDVRRVDPQDIQPRDEQRCQEDAAGNKNTGEYLHQAGCFVKAVDYMEAHMILLVVFGIGIGVCQLFAVIVTCMVMRRIEDEEKD